jgi:hypothetical protein
METLHIVPGLSAAGSLNAAMREAGRDDEVLAWPDDLSCGPINPADPDARAAWWNSFYCDGETGNDWDIEQELNSFWDRVATTEKRIVLWTSAHCANELSFYLAWTDQIEDRPVTPIDVTGFRYPFTHRDGTVAQSGPAKSVSTINNDGLRALLGSEQPVSIQRLSQARNRWRQLKAEDAPFRVITEDGLISAPVDYFDELLIRQAASEWRKTAYIVGAAMGSASEPYFQVGDMMLLVRVVALVEQGKLLVEGNPWKMQSSRVRLPS